MFALLLILWPLAELFVAIKVADAIGFLEMVLLLMVAFPLGAWALRSQGADVWRRFALAVAEHRTPAREAIDGALVLAGGTLIMIPGFITDVIGALLVLPPTRMLARAAIVRNLRSRVVVRAARFGARRSYDVESSARDVPPPKLPA